MLDIRHPLEILEEGFTEFQYHNLPRGTFLGYLGKGDGTSTIINTYGTARREVFYYTMQGSAKLPAAIAVLGDGSGLFYKDSASYVDLPVVLQYLPDETWPTITGIVNDYQGRNPLAGKNAVESEIAGGAGYFKADGTVVGTGDFDLGDHGMKRQTWLDFKSTTAPANPSAGYGRLYIDTSDSHLKWRNSSGTVVDLQSLTVTYPAGLTEMRLSLTNGTPVTTSDVTAATTFYLNPYKGNRIALYNGTSWIVDTFGVTSVSVPASTNTNYDVFVYDSGGSIGVETVAWTNDTTRATALTTQDGVLVKSGAATRKYIGTIRTTGVSGQCEDSASKRFVWNYYNRARRYLTCKDTTDTWTYTTATWRAANNSTAVGTARVEVLIGWSEDVVQAINYAQALNAAANFACGIGVDSDTTNSAQVYGGLDLSSQGKPLTAIYEGYPGVGYHYIQRIEISQASNTTTWYGDNGLSYIQFGMMVALWA